MVIEKVDTTEERLGKKIDDVEGRLTQRIEDVETGLKTVVKRVEGVETGLKTIGRKLDETREELSGKIDKINVRLDGHDDEIARLKEEQNLQ